MEKILNNDDKRTSSLLPHATTPQHHVTELGRPCQHTHYLHTYSHIYRGLGVLFRFLAETNPSGVHRPGSPPPWESRRLGPESNAGHPPEPQLAKQCPSTASSDPLMSHGSNRDTTSLTGTSSISLLAPGRTENDFKLLSRQPCPHRSCRQRLHAGATLQPPGRPRSRRHTPASLTCPPPRPYLRPATPPG